MRMLAVLTLSTAAFLAPRLVAADPALPDAAPAATAASQSATPDAPAAKAASVGPEKVVVRPPASESNPDEIVCKMSAPTTGTRLGGGRECHTAREWEDQQKRSQENVRNTQMHGLQPGRMPGG